MVSNPVDNAELNQDTGAEAPVHLATGKMTLQYRAIFNKSGNQKEGIFRGHFVSAAVKVSLERLLSPGAMDRQMGFSLLPVNHRFVNIQMWFFFVFLQKVGN